MLLKETRTCVAGPTGQLEVAWTEGHPMALLCHPHPLHGGTMDNKVITTLARVCRQLGMATVRFNFRGVGQSEGTFDHGQGEHDDVLAVQAWAHSQDLGPLRVLVGFSFGGRVALQAAAALQPHALITVAPAVQTIAPIHSPCPWLVIQGQADDTVPCSEVVAFAARCVPTPDVVQLPHVDHFFHGKLTVLSQEAHTWLTHTLP